MNMRVIGFVILYLLGVSWACDARHVVVSYSVQEREPQTLNEFSGNNNVCTLCEEFASQALDYISENKTQTEIIGIWHNACNQLKSFKQQCVTLVDYYAPLLFLEVTSVEPVDLCRKVNLCQQVATFSSQLKEDSCGLCHRTVSEVLVKLKDPDTQLEIIEMLLKACNSVENYVKKCKRLVFQYGPLILVNAEEYLEKTDICTALHACNPSSVSMKEATSLEIGSMRADS
ncbi:uncharacterized protein LOC126800265 [Argentina anserina]|uniref:uncharacterized protein LOC126800265 n=1 Tax=Argentina anserina TaxID=57926 RepID=UPI002176762D|nr:uncharacterized protein LOC126800265 [Potentilla anserina]